MLLTPSTWDRKRLYRTWWIACAPVAAAFVLGATCSTLPPDDGSGTGQDPDTLGVTARLVAPSANVALSVLDTQPLSVIYSITGDVDRVTGAVGFYVRVAGSGPDAGDLSDPIVIDPLLDTGDNKTFSFDPRITGVGFYRVGIRVTVRSATNPIDKRSGGVLQVQGPPDPRFILPSEPITVFDQGADVLVKFDAGDPEGVVQWRLFYLTSTDLVDGPADQLGTQLGQPGSGNAGDFTWSTTGLPPGEYRLGLSATDSGASVAVTQQRGDGDKIRTIPNDERSTPAIRIVLPGQSKPPTIAITRPGSSDESLFLNAGFNVQFAGTVNEEGATGKIDVFYDRDRNVANGFNSIASELPVTATSVPFPTNLPEGTYNVGATIDDGINAPVTTYSAGRVTVVRTVTLSVTDPKTTVPVRPGDTVAIKWTTNAPVGAGTAEVVSQRVDSTGQPIGLETKILQGAPLSRTSVDFSSQTPGFFQFTVRLLLTGGTTKEAKAPANVRVTSLPAVFWLGSLASTTPPFAGAIFGGANFEDNAGTSFSTVGDLDGNGTDEFLISARYGKPFFTNPDGVGPGEAYLVYNSTGSARVRGTFNLNSLGTNVLKGVTFAGVRTPQASNATDGLSSVTRMPDVDGDGRDEMVFGIPNTDSRGHNVDPEQNGVVDPRSLASLEREKQFTRGGVILVSSRNSILRDPTRGEPVILLDMVGQDFDANCVDPEPDAPGLEGFGADLFYLDSLAINTQTGFCEGECANSGGGGGSVDSNGTINYGFVRALARDYFHSYFYSSFFYGGNVSCNSVLPFFSTDCLPLGFCRAFTQSCEPFSPHLHFFVDDPNGDDDPNGMSFTDGRSGFYTAFLAATGETVVRNLPHEPFGARIIGVGVGDLFGTSLTLSKPTRVGAGDIIVSSPNRSARGILLGPRPAGCDDSTLCGGEVDGLESGPGVAKTNVDSGVAYLFGLRSFWTDDSQGRTPPRPHQYVVGEPSHCGGPTNLIPNIDALRIAGFEGDKITNIVGIDDFNGDHRDDLAIGAPNANGGQGRVYVGYRRDPSIEGDYVLEKLARNPADPGRLDGMLITTNGTDSFGSSLATGFDFNNDGVSDLAIGSPTAANGVGEVLILFGGSDIISPQNGVSVATLLATRRVSDGAPVAARLRGNRLDVNGAFGFNIANGGDLDGDGLDDLLVAAPNATPRFDNNPNDTTDTLSTAGVDVDQNGQADSIPGADNLANAGLVYVIYGKNRLDNIRTCTGSGILCTANDQCGTGQVCTSGDVTVNIDQLGKSGLRGFIVAGRRTGDHLGGGDAGDIDQLGNANKIGRGRSFGLASAGDVDGDGRSDILIGSVLADPRRDPTTDVGVQNGGEAYLIYGSEAPK